MYEKFDLRQYKPATVQRRIARRMALTGLASYEDYLSLLRDRGEERQMLTQDLLIHVTCFFRDPAAFELLERQITGKILNQLEEGEDLRIWVAGCASGEEAYSITILFLEAMKKRGRSNPIKVFATDVDENSIHTARKGVYSASSIEGVAPHLLDRYFVQSEGEASYRVDNPVRGLISFAKQNLTSDPPFGRMHLIACRNVLIYLRREVQERILNSFYFSLNRNGFLFLGSSENLGNRSQYFRAESTKWRLYQKQSAPEKGPEPPRQLHFMTRNLGMDGSGSRQRKLNPEGLESHREQLPRSERMRRALVEVAMPASVIVNGDGQLLYSCGDLSNFLTHPEGEPQNELIRLVKPQMRTRVRSGLYQVKKQNKTVVIHFSEKQGGSNAQGSLQSIRLEFKPILEQNFTDGMAICITFQVVGSAEAEASQSVVKVDEAQAIRDLEQELAETKEELRNTVEELETHCEELKAAHEEALSTNEELQSSNEEQEASAEELSALNEELSTVNAQLKEKIEDLRRANEDVENLFASTDLPTLFLDPNLHIQRFNPAAEELLKISRRDLERPLSDLWRELIDAELVEGCRSVLRSFEPVSSEHKTSDRKWYLRKITPYRSEDRRVDGVVILFQDVTEPRELARRAENRERQQAIVSRLGMMALDGINPEDLMQQAVRQVAHVLDADFCKVLMYQPEQDNFLLVAGMGWRDGLVGKATVPGGAESQAGYTMSSQEPVVTEDLSKEKRFVSSRLLVDHGVLSGISCTINTTNPVYGVIGVHSRRLRAFTQDDATFLQAVSNLLSSALHTQWAVLQLEENEKRFRDIANSIPQLAWIAGPDGRISWFNERCLDYTGKSIEELQGWGWQAVHHPDHVEGVVQRLTDALQNEVEWEDTFPLRGADGEYRWFLSRALPIRDSQGKVVQWFGTNTDITESLDQKEALLRSEERFQLAKESRSMGVFDYTIKENRIVWDDCLYELWGIDRKPFLTFEEAVSGIQEEDLPSVQEDLDASCDPEGTRMFAVNYRVINRKTGGIHWVKCSGVTRFQGDEPIRMTGIIEDVTEEEETRRQLAFSEERLRFTMATARVGVWMIDLDTGQADCSIECDQIFGYDEPVLEWSYQVFFDHVHPDDRSRVVKSFEIAKEKRIWDFECRILTVPNQEERWIWAKGKIQSDTDGNDNRMIGIVLDVTGRKNLENNLRNAISELRAADRKKNEFLSILGHELRNPLAAISGGVELLKDLSEGNPEILEMMGDGVGTMSKLLDDLLDLRRVSENVIEMDRKLLCFNDVLRRVIRDNSERIERHGLRFDTRIEGDLWLKGDRIRLEQIFNNLLANAAKYTRSGGRVMLYARKSGDLLEVVVEDDGVGLDEYSCSKIFDPFYQVKQEGASSSGLGIGLALSKRLVELHEGSIRAESDGHDQGSAFIVHLPLAAPPVGDEDRGEEVPVAKVRPGLRVLVIEDDPHIIRTIPHRITKYGCEVQVAETGASGLKIAADFKPNVILLDIGLPDRSGHEIAKELRINGFKGLIVALSGYSHEESRQRSAEVGCDCHLAKPVSSAELARTLALAN
ncbi:MAG: CheR family methyltransferase [Puniceicoccales bacterium]